MTSTGDIIIILPDDISPSNRKQLYTSKLKVALQESIAVYKQKSFFVTFANSLEMSTYFGKNQETVEGFLVLIISIPYQVPTIAVLGSGGGFRATTGFSAACRALDEMDLLDSITYLTGLSGSAW